MTSPLPPLVWGLPRWTHVAAPVVGVLLFCAGAALRLREDPDGWAWFLLVLALGTLAWVGVMLLRRARGGGWPLPLSSGLLWLGLGTNQLAGGLEGLPDVLRVLAFVVALGVIVASLVATRAEARARRV